MILGPAPDVPMPQGRTGGPRATRDAEATTGGTGWVAADWATTAITFALMFALGFALFAFVL